MPVLKIKKSDGTWQEVWGALGGSGGSSGGASMPKLTSITMPASEWKGSSSPYSQVVTCNGVDVNSKLDLQPDAEQVVALHDAEISLMASNNNGVVTIWSIGGLPTSDMEMQVLITDVEVIV